MAVPIGFQPGEPSGAIDFVVLDEAWSAFGSFMTSDIQGSTSALLDVLAAVEDALRGEVDHVPLSGNSWEGWITPSGMHLEDMFSDDWRGDYPLDQAHEGLFIYWMHLSPTSPERHSEMSRWEAKEGRTHPCRNHRTL